MWPNSPSRPNIIDVTFSVPTSNSLFRHAKYYYLVIQYQYEEIKYYIVKMNSDKFRRDICLKYQSRFLGNIGFFFKEKLRWLRN